VTTEIDTNQQASKHIDRIYNKTNKPYKFLFLNGTPWPHRVQLLKRLSTLLNQSLYTWTSQEENCEKIQLLPSEYESLLFVDNLTQAGNQKINVLQKLFNHGFGGIHAVPNQYIDTYFSLVTETVFDQPPSFRTEKIWKPIAMAHPWIAVANAGYYRDMHNLGFKTFGHLIDETFDQIEDSQKRIERIAEVVTDLCSQNLDEFLAATQDICKYNQQHLADMRQQVRKEFPERFLQFIARYQFNE
jgi:hypothetical protein